MYSIKRRYRAVTKHLDELIEDADRDSMGFASSDAFSATYCLAEKLVRRVLMKLMVDDPKCQQKTMQDAASAISSLSNFKKLAEKWKKHEPNSLSLESVIGATAFQILSDAFETRCTLLHGEGYPGIGKLRESTKKLRCLVDELHRSFGREYGFSGWKTKQ